MQLVKTTVIAIALIAGITWLCGAMIDNLLPVPATRAAALICVVLLAAYSVFSIIGTRRRERRYINAVHARKTKVSEFEEEAGFCITFKSLGSSRMFAVDEENGLWFLLDYYHDPEKTVLHRIDSICGIRLAPNAEYVPVHHKKLMFNAKKLSPTDALAYPHSIGVVIELAGEDAEHEFVNCFKTEKDAEIISEYLERITGLQAVKAVA